MKKLLATAFVITATFSFAGQAFAATTFKSILTSEQETPSLPDEGSGGMATLVLSDDRTALSYDIQLFGLDLDGNQTPGDANDNVTRVHIHRAPVANPGPIVYGMIDGNPALRNDLDDLVVDVIGNRITGVWDMNEGNGTTLANELGNLFARNLYLNVHTTDHGAGEIRGQIVPEPTSMMLALVAWMALASVCRRSRR
jgi:hypothetical protein